MSRPKRKDEAINLTKPELLSGLTEDDALKKLMKTLLQEVLEAEMDQTLHAGILEARYERVRENGVGHSRAVLITLGIGWDGRRHVLSVELANRGRASSWKDHLKPLPAPLPKAA